jgi:NAD(P)-dependent dehydrogenase (short-subunit alcohol dehydrogenase family)
MKRILVTGGSGGIGRAVVTTLMAAGYDVIASDALAGEFVDGRWVADLTDDAQCRALVDEVAVGGAFDGLVIAHGVEGADDVLTLHDDKLRRVMAIDFTSTVSIHRAAAPAMTDDAVTVVIASQAGLRGERASAGYCAAKFAVVGWFSAVALERSQRMRIVCPGAIDTPLVQRAFEGMSQAAHVPVEQIATERTRAIPTGRLGRPEEVAEVISWLIGLDVPRLLVAPTGGEVLA